MNDGIREAKSLVNEVLDNLSYWETLTSLRVKAEQGKLVDVSVMFEGTEQEVRDLWDKNYQRAETLAYLLGWPDTPEGIARMACTIQERMQSL